MKEFILFLMTFIMIFIVYKVFIVRKYKKKDTKKQLPEVSYLINKYHIDLDKISYKRLLNIVSIVSSFDIALLVSLSLLADNVFIEMIIALILVVPIILISYSLIGKYYKMKGLTKDV